MTCCDAVMPACHAIYLIFVHFLRCYVLSHKFLAVSTREIKHQYKEARGTRPRCNCRKYFACNLAKIHSHVCTGGKGSVLIWGISACWNALRVWLMPYISFSLCYTNPISPSCSPALSLGRIRVPMGCGQLFPHSQEQFWMSDICWSREGAGAQLWGPSNLSRDRPLWFRSRWCWGRDILHRAFKYSTWAV